MSITAAVLTCDGRRDTLVKTIESFTAQVSGPITRKVIYTDYPNGITGTGHLDWLAQTFGPEGWEVAATISQRGYSPAVRTMWADLAVQRADRPQCDWVFHLEDDFMFNRPVDLTEIMEVMNGSSQVVQMVLRRQAWNEAEKAAGGLVELHPEWFTEVRSLLDVPGGLRWAPWLEHVAFWSFNPCLYRQALTQGGWFETDEPASEGRFRFELERRGHTPLFGMWGALDDDPWVHHIGENRVGSGY